MLFSVIAELNENIKSDSQRVLNISGNMYIKIRFEN